ncbi:MAG: carbohydrate ABC transporter permease [Defluviitaleaceae bacterium]|nr:carbohydrate ABC transporter permease [Defluviitaleaceae bacterium]MCL2273760.1 carbohydrate ABC transporter permease [Defluviitaleaceae bacterium]
MTQRLHAIAESPRFKNNLQKWTGSVKNFILGLGIAVIVAGVCYIIIAPLVGIISRAFMSPSDVINPLVFLFPLAPTLYNLRTAFDLMGYNTVLLNTLAFAVGMAVLHALVCSFVGYGFARFKFPGSNVLFGLVIVSIVVPIQSYMIPMFLNFRFFLGSPDLNLLGTIWPILLLTATGVGIRSGLYIYIFRQFFRGIPKELEEAAFIDGAGPMGTYLRIMLPNAVPACVTVFLFALVWHYNDTYYTSMLMTGNNMMASALSSLGFSYAGWRSLMELPVNPILTQMVVFGGVLLAIAPVMIIYLFLQRFFVEGLERSGIVG